VRQRLLVTLSLLTAACATPQATNPPPAAVPEYTYEIVREYPHDPQAFTEGLLLHNGFLWESTGLEGRSAIRKLKLETGETLQRTDLPPAFFGEGIVIWHGKDNTDHLIQLTYKTQTGFVYNLNTLAMERRFSYPGEGWALTHDGKRLIMSDGSPQLRFWDPETLAEQGRLTITDAGRPVSNLNELEWVKGEIFANVWLTTKVARINPTNGRVTGWINLAGLPEAADLNGNEDVLNGIAYDAAADRLLVTGKNWSKIYQIRLVKR
jgi:glutaminyl-peptide cyclotransferase